MRTSTGNFNSNDWFKQVPSGFDLGVALFLLNELDHPESFLRGARHLVKTRTSLARCSRLALVLINPILLLKDLSDYSLLRTNRRKFEELEGYSISASGWYVFSRGDYAVKHHHYSLTSLYKLFWDCGWRQQYLSEIYYSPGRCAEDIANNNRDMIEDQYPKALFVVLDPRSWKS